MVENRIVEEPGSRLGVCRMFATSEEATVFLIWKILFERSSSASLLCNTFSI